MLRHRAVLMMGVILFLGGCSRQKPVSRENLQGDATKIVSISAEAELLCDLVVQGRTASPYAAAHPHYLQDQDKEVSKELDRAGAAAGLESSLQALRAAAQQLQDTLAVLPQNSPDPRWSEARRRFALIRQNAEHVRRAL